MKFSFRASSGIPRERACLPAGLLPLIGIFLLVPSFQSLSPHPAAIRGDRGPGQGRGADGLLETSTVFSVYGRAFDIAPLLGHLGTYKDFDEMAADIPKWVDEIEKYNDGRKIIPAVHLIYAMAVPCDLHGFCLDYLETAVPRLVEHYIKHAAERGWIVVLDTQLGRSDPVTQVNRMIDKGYLKYDNVHVAIDPEFHVYPEREIPGTPIGTIDAAEINDAQKILDDYVRAQGLKTKKILIVHQFGDPNVNDGVPFMIENKKSLQAFENVELVIDHDGLGSPVLKVIKYNLITDPAVYPFIRFRGIKIFFPDPWDKAGHFDKPPMTMEEVFGVKAVLGRLRIKIKPNVVIIA